MSENKYKLRVRYEIDGEVMSESYYNLTIDDVGTIFGNISGNIVYFEMERRNWKNGTIFNEYN